MTEHWEYLAAVLVYATEFTPPAPQTWTNSYTLFRPGDADPGGETGPITGWPDWITVLNRLGREGWELTTGSVMDTTIVSNSHGWSQVGIPVRQSFLFKRRSP